MMIHSLRTGTSYIVSLLTLRLLHQNRNSHVSAVKVFEKVHLLIDKLPPVRVEFYRYVKISGNDEAKVLLSRGKSGILMFHG